MKHPVCLIRRLLLLVWFCVSSVRATSLVFHINAHAEECFILVTGPTDPNKAGRSRFLTGSYEQIDERSPEPIIFFVMDAKDKVVYQSKESSFAQFRVLVEPSAKYWLCLQNHNQGPDEKYNHELHGRHMDGYERVIGLSYNLVYEAAKEMDTDKPGPLKVETHSSTWLDKAETVRESLRSLVHHHDFMRVREMEHRTITEKTFGDVLLWTLVEAAVVLTVVRLLGVVVAHFFSRVHVDSKYGTPLRQHLIVAPSSTIGRWTGSLLSFLCGKEERRLQSVLVVGKKRQHWDLLIN